MKTFAASTLILLSIATAAHAAPAAPRPATGTTAGHACTSAPLERVALTATPCCAGRLSCPQLLANTGLVKPKRADRT